MICAVDEGRRRDQPVGDGTELPRRVQKRERGPTLNLKSVEYRDAIESKETRQG